jgi:hypothetical protein
LQKLSPGHFSCLLALAWTFISKPISRCICNGKQIVTERSSFSLFEELTVHHIAILDDLEDIFMDVSQMLSNVLGLLFDAFLRLYITCWVEVIENLQIKSKYNYKDH